MKTDSFCAEQHRVEFHRASVNVSAVFDLALHISKPDNDNQRSNEVDLDGYERVSVMRSESKWIVRDRKVTNAELIRFPTIRKGKATARWLSFGIDGKIRRLVKLEDAVDMTANRRVEFEPGAIEIVEEVMK